MAITIGIDVGKSSDPTAIVVAQSEMRGGKQHFTVPFLTRLELGTPYPKITDRAVRIIRGVEHKLLYEFAERMLMPAFAPELDKMVKQEVWVLVDSTGVGAPVVDMLRDALPDTKVCGVIFTHGEHNTVRWRSSEGTMGKSYLVSRLQVLIQTGRIHLPQVEESKVLLDELRNYEVNITEKGVDTYGAFKVGSHDDLVTALGLATLLDHKPVREVRSYSYA